MKKCVVIIPIYQDNPNVRERASFNQVVKTLKNHPITIITYKSLNINLYKKIAKSNNVIYNTEYFDQSYFNSVIGYNRLCLSLDLYKRFSNYKYILIYQLDAWVFYDNLDFWCNKNYDYIGAPWFERYSTHEEGYKLWAVGNGGFSLRKTSYFIKVLSWKLPVKKLTLKRVFKNFNLNYILFLFGYKNTINYYIEKYVMNEDVFFSQFLEDTWIPPKLPTPLEAARFSFEKSPTYLMKLSNNQLPFGCHAFHKYEYSIFWNNYIPINIEEKE